MSVLVSLRAEPPASELATHDYVYDQTRNIVSQTVGPHRFEWHKCCDLGGGTHGHVVLFRRLDPPPGTPSSSGPVNLAVKFVPTHYNLHVEGWLLPSDIRMAQLLQAIAGPATVDATVLPHVVQNEQLFSYVVQENMVHVPMANRSDPIMFVVIMDHHDGDLLQLLGPESGAPYRTKAFALSVLRQIAPEFIRLYETARVVFTDMKLENILYSRTPNGLRFFIADLGSFTREDTQTRQTYPYTAGYPYEPASPVMGVWACFLLLMQIEHIDYFHGPRRAYVAENFDRTRMQYAIEDAMFEAIESEPPAQRLQKGIRAFMRVLSNSVN